MALPGTCAACGETLQGVVRYCPFCGTSHRVAPPAPEPRPAGPVQAARPPEPTAPPQPAAAPMRLVPRVVPAPRPVQPPNRVPPAPAPAPTPVAAAAPVRRPRTPAQRRARDAAVRKLLLATVILLCGAVLWHHLTSGPHGTLRVRLTRAVEGAVLVDGVPDGSADEPIAVPAGRHLIGFAAPDWSTAGVPVRLVDGETRVVTLMPVPHRAELRLDSLPAGARLIVDGRRSGRAPATLLLQPGAHDITAGLPGYQPARSPVTLSAGERRSVVLALQALPPRRLHLLASPGRWSEPVALAPGERFALLFPAPIRLRLGARVLLLQGGAPVDCGSQDARGLSVTAVGDDPVPVDLIVHPSLAPG